MLKWVLGIAAGLVWCLLIFLATWWFTFPSDAVVDRLAYEVQEASDGQYALKAASASPWWTGLSLSGVTLLSVDEGGAGTPMVMADSVSARTSLGSVLTGGLPVYAVIEMDGEPIVLEAELDRSANPPRLTHLDGEARKLGVPTLSRLLAPLGARMSGEGSLELLIDAEIGEEVDDHDGRLKISGESITLDLSLPDPLSGGEFVLKDMEVSEIDLVVDVNNGRMELKRGTIVSDRAEIEIDLDMTLNKRLDRSRLQGSMVLSNLGGELETFKAAFNSALWDDGKYHYRISCTVQRLSASCIRPERQPRGRVTPELPDAEDIQDRIELNRERRERRAERADRAAAASPDRRRPGSAANDAPLDEDEEPLDEDEELLDEDEEPLDDELPPADVEMEVDLDIAAPPPGMEIPRPELAPNVILPPDNR